MRFPSNMVFEKLYYQKLTIMADTKNEVLENNTYCFGRIVVFFLLTT